MENVLVTSNTFRIENEAFEHIGDLEWFEGPLLSLFLENTSNSPYILHWVDIQNDTHRWLLYPVSPRALQLYLNGKITNEDLIWLQPAGMLRLVDMNADMHVQEVKYCSAADLPVDYLPTAESYFDVDICPNLPKIKRVLEIIPTLTLANYPSLAENTTPARQVAEGQRPTK